MLAALEAGALHPGHLWPMLEKVAPIADDTVRAQVEAGLLAWAAGRVTTPAQLGAKARREVLRRDAGAAARALEQAVRERGVSWQPGRVEGMGSVTADLTLPEARALLAALRAYADALEDPPGAAPRSRGQKMADSLLDLVLRPGEHDLPPVQVLLTLVAPVAALLGEDLPAEVDGQPVPAEVARQLLQAPTGADLRPAGQPGEAPDAGEEMRWDGPLPSAEELARDAAEQQDFALWSEQLEDRILAGAFDDLDPLSGPDADPSPDPLPDPSPALNPSRAEEHEQAPAPAPTAGDTVSPSAPSRQPQPAGPPEPPDDRPEPAAPEAEQRWWAMADRAVEEAGQALLGAHRATSHAAGLVERPRIAVTDAVTGALLALTDLTGLRRVAHCGLAACRRRPHACTHDLTGRPGLGPPPPTEGYRPGAGLDRFLRARDRRCRFPGCRRPVPHGGELDHDTAYPDGPTDATNLLGYCTANHRGKHQAPGWRHELAPDGTLTVTTPTGLVAVTTPPPY